MFRYCSNKDLISKKSYFLEIKVFNMIQLKDFPKIVKREKRKMVLSFSNSITHLPPAPFYQLLFLKY